MTIKQDLQQSNIASAIVELFAIDLTPCGLAQVFYFTPNVGTGSITFDGNVYEPFPIQGSGWEANSDGKQPQPSLSLSNVTRYLASYIDEYGDLVGAKVTRYLTLKKYLSSASFTRTNLLNYSESINTNTSGWLKVLTATTTDATTAPDGTMTAEKLAENSTSTPGSPYFYATQTVTSGLSGGTYTFSVYLKAAERTYANLRFDDGAGTNVAQATVDLSTGATLVSSPGGTISSVSADVTDCTNGWYRAAITATWSSITSVRCFIRLATGISNFTTNLGYAGVIGNGIYAWGAQLNIGSSALPYQATGLNTQPYAASEVFASHLYVVNQMSSLTSQAVEFKLSSLIDRPGRKWPRTQVLRGEFPGVGLLRKS